MKLLENSVKHLNGINNENTQKNVTIVNEKSYGGLSALEDPSVGFLSLIPEYFGRFTYCS